MDAHPLVRGSGLVAAALGEWPSFHDMTVVDARRHGTTFELTVHAWRPTSEADEAGYFVALDHHLVTIRMNGVVSSTLPDDYRSDVLFELVFGDADGRVRVTVTSAVGAEFSGEIVCHDIAVIDVVRCDRDGKISGEHGPR